MQAMTKIVDLQSFRDKAIEQRSFGPWQRRFGESYGIACRVSDLSDKTLFFLAQPGENSSIAFYELIMGALDLGPAAKFYYLSNDDQMRVVDIHLLVADQVRFELMRRLGWVQGLPCGSRSLVGMVQSSEKLKRAAIANPPELSESHPEYGAYKQLAVGDREVFIRRLLREALEAFKKQLGE
jgi:hypothetical protein